MPFFALKKRTTYGFARRACLIRIHLRFLVSAAGDYLGSLSSPPFAGPSTAFSEGAIAFPLPV